MERNWYSRKYNLRRTKVPSLCVQRRLGRSSRLQRRRRTMASARHRQFRKRKVLDAESAADCFHRYSKVQKLDRAKYPRQRRLLIPLFFLIVQNCDSNWPISWLTTLPSYTKLRNINLTYHLKILGSNLWRMKKGKKQELQASARILYWQALYHFLLFLIKARRWQKWWI